MTDVRDAILQAARESGIDPAFALAVAERESSFNPDARASKTIYGIYQMSRDLRHKYGAGDSDDPLTQARAFGRHAHDLRAAMRKHLGREPTHEELYTGHYFGPLRAARMHSGAIPADTPVEHVFTPMELAANGNFARAGTTGRLTSSILADMTRRQAKYGGASTAPARHVDFSQYGETPAQGRHVDFSQYGTQPGAAGARHVDFSQYGKPVSEPQPAHAARATAVPVAQRFTEDIHEGANGAAFGLYPKPRTRPPLRTPGPEWDALPVSSSIEDARGERPNYDLAPTAEPTGGRIAAPMRMPRKGLAAEAGYNDIKLPPPAVSQRDVDALRPRPYEGPPIEVGAPQRLLGTPPLPPPGAIDFSQFGDGA